MNGLSKSVFTPLLTLLLTVASAQAQVDSADHRGAGETPSPVFFSPQRAVPIGMVDYGHHAIDPDLKDFIAGHYDSFVTGDHQLDFAFYQNANPALKMFCYFNSMMLAPDQPAPSGEGAYLHDGSIPVSNQGPDNRLGKFFEGVFHFVMDPSSPLWQQHARTRIASIMGAGFDGVLLDDVFAHLMHEGHFNASEPLVIGTPGSFTTFSTVPPWYHAQGSHDGWRTLLTVLKKQLPGLVMYNGINDLAENGGPIDPALHPMDYLGGCDGSGQEGFVYNGKWVANPANGLIGDEYWEATVGVLMNIPAGKRHSVVAYGEVNFWRARAYAFASYLIGYKPKGSSTFYYAPDEFTLTWLPEWTLDLGAPVETYPTLQEYKQVDHQVFVRRFARAVVIVNPYAAATGTIPLDGRYYEVKQTRKIKVVTLAERRATAIGAENGLGFTPVTTVQLQGYSAVILMKK